MDFTKGYTLFALIVAMAIVYLAPVIESNLDDLGQPRFTRAYAFRAKDDSKPSGLSNARQKALIRRNKAKQKEQEEAKLRTFQGPYAMVSPESPDSPRKFDMMSFSSEKQHEAPTRPRQQETGKGLAKAISSYSWDLSYAGDSPPEEGHEVSSFGKKKRPKVPPRAAAADGRPVQPRQRPNELGLRESFYGSSSFSPPEKGQGLSNDRFKDVFPWQTRGPSPKAFTRAGRCSRDTNGRCQHGRSQTFDAVHRFSIGNDLSGNIFVQTEIERTGLLTITVRCPKTGLEYRRVETPLLQLLHPHSLPKLHINGRFLNKAFLIEMTMSDGEKIYSEVYTPRETLSVDMFATVDPQDSTLKGELFFSGNLFEKAYITLDRSVREGIDQTLKTLRFFPADVTNPYVFSGMFPKLKPNTVYHLSVDSYKGGRINTQTITMRG